MLKNNTTDAQIQWEEIRKGIESHQLLNSQTWGREDCAELNATKARLGDHLCYQAGWEWDAGNKSQAFATMSEAGRLFSQGGNRIVGRIIKKWLDRRRNESIVVSDATIQAYRRMWVDRKPGDPPKDPAAVAYFVASYHAGRLRGKGRSNLTLEQLATIFLERLSAPKAKREEYLGKIRGADAPKVPATRKRGRK